MIKRNAAWIGQWLLIFAALCCRVPLAQSAEVMSYIYHPPESRLDQCYLYHWKILKTALEKTTAQFGS